MILQAEPGAVPVRTVAFVANAAEKGSHACPSQP